MKEDFHAHRRGSSCRISWNYRASACLKSSTRWRSKLWPFAALSMEKMSSSARSISMKSLLVYFGYGVGTKQVHRLHLEYEMIFFGRRHKGAVVRGTCATSRSIILSPAVDVHVNCLTIDFSWATLESRRTSAQASLSLPRRNDTARVHTCAPVH